MTVTEQELIERSEYPRVSLAQLEGSIIKKQFVQEGLLTICILTLANGFTVVGQSACAVPGNFKLDVGRRLAETDAKNKIWPLLGYELKTKVALVYDLIKQCGSPSPNHKPYVGTKALWAIPSQMLRWDNSLEDGYQVTYPDGYVSWSPKEVFEAAYTEIDIHGDGSQGGLTWRHRVMIEAEELETKFNALANFVDTSAFKAIDEVQQTLLKRQMDSMCEYLSILQLRLSGEGEASQS